MAEETRTRLGRGLAALIGDVGAEATTGERSATRHQQRRIAIEFLKPNPRNPRRTFSEPELDELANSIRERGIIQPIVVRNVRGASDSYEIIAGERRWRAAQRAGLHEVPVIVLDVSDAEALELAIIENVQRADLNALEEAGGYEALASQYHHSNDDIAAIVGKSRSHVANTLRLLKLPEAVKAYIRSGALSAGHARALIGQPDPEGMAQAIVEKGLSVRQAESLRTDTGAKKKSKARAEQDADTAALGRRLSDSLGLFVEIRHGNRGGELRIKYRTLDQLDDVIQRLEKNG
jgi:ParB family chromosome partitioning protein